MKKIIVSIAITCYCCCIYAQQVSPDVCIQTMGLLQNKIAHSHIEKGDIVGFWSCFENCYDNSIEILEFRNEILYALLQLYPKLTLSTLQEQSTSILDRVVHDLANPLHEGINLLKVYYKVATAEQVDNHLKECLLSGLQIAIDNKDVDN